MDLDGGGAQKFKGAYATPYSLRATPNYTEIECHTNKVIEDRRRGRINVGL